MDSKIILNALSFLENPSPPALFRDACKGKLKMSGNVKSSIDNTKRGSCGSL